MKDHYIPTDYPELAALDDCYRKLFDKVILVEAALEAVKSAKSERINNGIRPEAEDKLTLYFQREAIYEAAHIRLKTLVRPMHPLLDPVREECQRLRGLFVAESELARRFYAHEIDNYKSMPIDLAVTIRANVFFAELLRDTASGFYATTMARYPGTRGIDGAFARGESKPREWVLKVSVHGSDFCFDGPGEGKTAPPADKYMTEEEANLKGWKFEFDCDMVGGVAVLYNVVTGREKALYDPKKFVLGTA